MTNKMEDMKREGKYETDGQTERKEIDFTKEGRLTYQLQQLGLLRH